jgi:cbb3-type cytochrome oxidase subunit 1
MWWLVLPLEFLVVLGVCAAMYYELGSFRKRPIFVTLLTLFGWSLSGLLVFLVPNDIVSVLLASHSHSVPLVVALLCSPRIFSVS